MALFHEAGSWKAKWREVNRTIQKEETPKIICSTEEKQTQLLHSCFSSHKSQAWELFLGLQASSSLTYLLEALFTYLKLLLSYVQISPALSPVAFENWVPLSQGLQIHFRAWIQILFKRRTLASLNHFVKPRQWRKKMNEWKKWMHTLGECRQEAKRGAMRSGKLFPVSQLCLYQFCVTKVTQRPILSFPEPKAAAISPLEFFASIPQVSSMLHQWVSYWAGAESRSPMLGSRGCCCLCPFLSPILHPVLPTHHLSRCLRILTVGQHWHSTVWSSLRHCGTALSILAGWGKHALQHVHNTKAPALHKYRQHRRAQDWALAHSVIKHFLCNGHYLELFGSESLTTCHSTVSTWNSTVELRLWLQRILEGHLANKAGENHKWTQQEARTILPCSSIFSIPSLCFPYISFSSSFSLPYS